MQKLYLLVPLAPLIGAIIAGLFGRFIGPTWSHRATIGLVFVSLVASIIIFMDVLEGNSYNGSVYTWLISGETRFEVGFFNRPINRNHDGCSQFGFSYGAYLYHWVYA